MATFSAALRHVKEHLDRLVPEDQVRQLCRDLGYRWRDRVLGPAVTVQLFLLQLLARVSMRGVGRVAELSVTAQAVCAAKMRLPLATTADVFAPGIALGHGIGRLGCFSAGCCWGVECHLPWAVTFHSDAAAPVPLNVPLHPAQLYETGVNLIIFTILYRMFNRSHRAGEIIGWYLVLYSIARFIIEFFRNHEQGLIAGLSLTQWIALGLLALGAAILVRVRQVQLAPQH